MKAMEAAVSMVEAKGVPIFPAKNSQRHAKLGMADNRDLIRHAKGGGQPEDRRSKSTLGPLAKLNLGF